MNSGLFVWDLFFRNYQSLIDSTYEGLSHLSSSEKYKLVLTFIYNTH
jgi:hypothetical protein